MTTPDHPRARRGPRHAPAGRIRLVLGLVVAALVISCWTALAAGAASATPNQADAGLATTTVSGQQLVATSTTAVPGGAAAGAAQAGASQPAAGTSTISVAGSDHRFLTEDRKILVIVGALIFVAVALTLLTIRYWRQTRPARIAALAPAPRHLAGGGAPLPEPDVDPSATAEHSIFAGTAGPPAGPRTAPAGPAGPPAGPRTAPAGSVRASAGPAAPPEGTDLRSRRAVAGADHRTADDDWQPRGTGEHERVDVAKPRGNRPGRDARRAALSRKPTDPDR